MIVFENKEIEAGVLSGELCFAVPIEIFSTVNGEEIITTYGFCKEQAERFYNVYRGRLLSEEALESAEKIFSEVADNIGYKRIRNENEMMLEYVFTPGMQMPKANKEIKVHKISSNAVLEEICAASGCDIEIADDGEDIIFAVVENGILRAYAGMNDVFYPDNSVEISVETAPDCRRRGLGSACVLSLVEHLISKGKTVRYKCSEANSASSALAEKCGFFLEGKRFSFVCEKI